MPSRARNTPIPATNAPDMRVGIADASVAFQDLIATKPVPIEINYWAIPSPNK